MGQQFIHIRGAKQNNLKNIDLDIPLNALTVVTGCQRFGKIDGGVRYSLRRRSTPLRRSFFAYARRGSRPHG